MPKMPPLGNAYQVECYFGFLDVLGFSAHVNAATEPGDVFTWFDRLRAPATASLLHGDEVCGCGQVSSYRHVILKVDFARLHLMQFGDTFLAMSTDVSDDGYRAVEAFLHNMFLHWLGLGELSRGAISRGTMFVSFADMTMQGIPSYDPEDWTAPGIVAAVGKPLVVAASLEKNFNGGGICVDSDSVPNGLGRVPVINEAWCKDGHIGRFLDWRPSIREGGDETMEHLVRDRPNKHRDHALEFWRLSRISPGDDGAGRTDSYDGHDPRNRSA